MAEHVTVEDAARALAVSDRQVRNLIAAKQLPAERFGSVWLIDAQAVRSRAQHAPSAGRPLSPAAAWAALHVVDPLFFASSPAAAEERLQSLSDRQLRHRLRKLLAKPRSASRWQQSLAKRAQRQRVWVHPGVLDGLVADPRLRLGGGAAAALHGAGIAGGDSSRYYVDEGSWQGLVHSHRLKLDREGKIDLMVIPAAVPEALRPKQGEAVPISVALADLLESDDARERHVAEAWFASVAFPQPS